MLKPIIKIPGGKTRLLPTLISHLPPDFLERSYTYVEPFVGGGALFLHLLEYYNTTIDHFIINDDNFDIFNLYIVIQKKDPEHLVKELNTYKTAHDREQYLRVRASFNELAEKVRIRPLLTDNQSLTRALQFLYLNKTGFNGLIRYNSKNEWNVPPGDYEKPSLCDKDSLSLLHGLLRSESVSTYCGDFSAALGEAANLLESENRSGLVYLDPPYHPISETSSFTSYTGTKFTEHNQADLKLAVDGLTRLGHKVMISNSNCPLIKDLYKDYNIIEIYNNRSINCKGEKRAAIKELLIKNY